MGLISRVSSRTYRTLNMSVQVNMYKVAPLVEDVKGKIKPSNIMYPVDRIFNGSLSADIKSTPVSGKDIVEKLSNLEEKIDEKIALRRLTDLDSKLDSLIGQLGGEKKLIQVMKKSEKSNSKKSESKKSDSKNSKKAAPALLSKIEPVSLPKKNIPAANLTNPSKKHLDLVIQVSPNAEPVFILAAIRSLQLAKSNVCVRVHYHSSVIKQDEAGYKFNSLMTAFDLALNADISRKVTSFDYVFTFLITNKLQNTNVDLCLNGAKHASICSDSVCAKFIWKLAGGAYCDECEYWADAVSAVLSDKKQLSSFQAEVKKNFSKGKGKFADVVVAILE